MIIQRYVIRAWLINLLIVTTTLLAVILLIVPFFQFQKYTALDAEFVFKVLPYFVPISLVYIIPLAVLLASLFVFGRLSEDNELLAMKSSGISLGRITRPILYLTVLLSIGVILINTHLIPYCHAQTRQLTISVFEKRLFSDSRGADEIKLPDGKITYVNYNNGIFEHVRLLKFGQKREDLVEELSARQGKFEIDKDNARLSLDLNKVYITRWETSPNARSVGRESAAPGKERTTPHLVKSDRLIYKMDVSTLFAPSRRNLASLTNRELNEMLIQYKDNPTKTRQVLFSKYQRYAGGLTPLIFALIGIPIGVLIRKGSKVAGIGISMLIVFVGYYPLTMFSNLLGVKKTVIPVMASVWLGNIIIGLAALALVYYIIKNDK
ncbi:MAG: LptF/LptG family permease [Planctomycetota bacterium]